MHVQITESAGWRILRRQIFESGRSRIANTGIFSLAVVLMATISFGCTSPKSSSDLAAKREEVAAKGAGVMPFDLERSTHVFEKKSDGGLQQVLSDDRDVEQIAAIRTHLSEEAARFSRGDFHDPAMIHGDNMAGLHQLVTGHEKLTIEYVDIDLGGQILYQADDAEMVEAIHLWFDAQLSDHGQHARAGGAHKQQH